MNMPITVLVADDEPEIRRGIIMQLQDASDIEIVGQAHDYASTVAQARLHQPDVVLMDIWMPPDAGGVRATAEITADCFAQTSGRLIKVIILSICHLDETVRAAISAGASGYLIKHSTPDIIVRAIQAVAEGDCYFSPEIVDFLREEFMPRSDPNKRTPDEFARLTPTERKIMILAAHGLSNKDIAQYLSVAESTVKTHIGRINSKLGLLNQRQIVACAYKSKLVKHNDKIPAPLRRK
jgi:DNA-binding NarL/FixJ family response regulator